jgi:hypothetical protein
VGEQFDNTNRGALFLNEYKEKGDNKPDYKGKVEVSRDRLKALIAASKDGNVVIYLSGWKKAIRSGQREGQTMLSMSVDEPKDPSKRKKADAPAEGEQQPFKEDDIPF